MDKLTTRLLCRGGNYPLNTLRRRPAAPKCPYGRSANKNLALPAIDARIILHIIQSLYQIIYPEYMIYFVMNMSNVCI